MATPFQRLPADYECRAFEQPSSRCPLCERSFQVAFKLQPSRARLDQLREHLVVEHRFVISDIGEIADLDGYLRYWRRQFAGDRRLSSFCAVIRTNSRPDDLAESQVRWLGDSLGDST